MPSSPVAQALHPVARSAPAAGRSRPSLARQRGDRFGRRGRRRASPRRRCRAARRAPRRSTTDAASRVATKAREALEQEEADGAWPRGAARRGSYRWRKAAVVPAAERDRRPMRRSPTLRRSRSDTDRRPFDRRRMARRRRRRDDAARSRTRPTAASSRASRAAARPTSTPRSRARARRARRRTGARLTAAERGRMLARDRPQGARARRELARLEALDVGKPLKQARADALALARYLEFYGGAADKVHGETLPYPDRLHRADAARAARRHRPHRAVELPDADRRPQRRRGAGDGQRLRAEAGRGGLPDGARLRRASPPRPACRPARSTSSPGSARKPARRCRRIRASTTSRSPARSRPARWSRRRRRRTSCR